MLQRLIYSLLIICAAGSTIAQSPFIGGYNVYYGHLHNHTIVSDGTGTDDDAYSYAKNIAKLDYFSTANHENAIDEAEWITVKTAADKYNEDGVFTTFRGFEWSGGGHIAVINTDDYPGISEEPTSNLEELCAWLETRDGVAFFNHPNRGEGKVFGGFASTPSYKIVGMELFNGTADYSMHYYNDGYWPDDGNLNHFAEANSRGWKIGASGSDDNHGATWGTRTDYRMAILAENLTRSDLFEAMNARRFYSTLDKNLALSFKIDTCEMGSSIEGGTYDAHIQARDSDEELFTRIMLYRNGIEMFTWNIDTSYVDLTMPVITFDNDFLYVKVTQADGDEAVSSPVFVKGGLFNSTPTCTLTSPLNGSHFEGPQSITITAEANDEDGPVTSVEFYVNGELIGSDTLAPYSIEYTIPDNGPYEVRAKVTDEVGSWAASSPVTFTVGKFYRTESSRIAEAMDDVEENPDGSMYTSSSDIELVYDGGNQIIGLRFTGLNIPYGAVIQSADIQFTVDEASSGACVLTIKGDDADNSPPFTSYNKSISGRVTTSAEVTWEPPDWPTVGAAGSDQKTPDLSSIVHEIVNRPGYTQRSAISMIIAGNGERTAEAYEGETGSAALMTVHYSFGIGSAIEFSGLDETRIRIYPNPVSNGKATIEIDSETAGKASVTIFDMWGRKCHQSQINNSVTIIDVSGISQGLYIINISIGNMEYTHKLLVD